MSCLALDDPTNQWRFCPSAGAALAFCVFFFLTTAIHLGQGIYYKKPYSWVIIMSGVWQLVAFVTRYLSIRDQTSGTLYQIWFIVILVAPLWTNAYIYMAMGRMVHNFLPDGRVFGVKSHRFGMWFVMADIIAFFVQIVGAGSASGEDLSMDEIMRGIHIYMGGMGLQQLFMIFFLVLAVTYHRRTLRFGTSTPSSTRLLYVIYTVLFLITVRIVFRMIEYANGIDGSGGIPDHEVYMYCLDSTPMLICLILLNIVHPGAVMPGKGGDLPSRKERKAAKRAAKASKKLGGHGDDSSELLAEQQTGYVGARGPYYAAPVDDVELGYVRPGE